MSRPARGYENRHALDGIRDRLRAAERAWTERWTPDAPVPAGERESAGLAAVRARTEAVDEAVRAVWANLAGRPGLAAIALGGYGRRELCPFSDVDILFLRAPAASTDGLDAVQTALWDLGLRLGAAVRTPDETISVARTDLFTRTSLLEARLIEGDRALFDDLAGRIGRLFRPAAFATETAEEVAQRRSRHGRVPGLAEPNVKEGAGGLRDAHAALWIARVLGRKAGGISFGHLADLGVAPDEIDAIERAYAHLLLVRWLLHVRAGRKADVFTLEARADLAARLDMAPGEAIRATVLAMRTIARAVDSVLGRATSPGRPAAEAASPAAAVLEALRRAAPASGALDDGTASAVRALLADRRAGAALEALHDAGALVRLIPEFAPLEGLAGADPLHRYTADAHTIEAVRVLGDLVDEAEAAPEGPVGRALASCRREVVALALLLHDVGKGLPGPEAHEEKAARIVPGVAARFGIAPDDAATVEFLVRNHLAMTHLAFRRDVDDPHVAADLADRVGTADRLAALYLVTICDVRAVAPDLWTDWKAALLATLYLRTLRALEVRQPPEAVVREAARRRRAAVEAQVGAGVPASEIERHFAGMPARYFLAFSPPQIAHHLHLVPQLADRPFVLDLYHNAAIGYTEVIVVTRTRVGLFSEIVGTLASRGINILSAQIHTRADGLAIDTFRVTDPDGRPVTDAARWAAVEADLGAILDGRTTVEALIEARRPYAPRPAGRTGVRVEADQEASPAQTVLEVEAPDGIGLLYKIASAIRAAQCGVTTAIIDTERGRAFDVFYVADSGGRKLDDEAARRLAGRVAAALEAT